MLFILSTFFGDFEQGQVPGGVGFLAHQLVWLWASRMMPYRLRIERVPFRSEVHSADLICYVLVSGMQPMASKRTS